MDFSDTHSLADSCCDREFMDGSPFYEAMMSAQAEAKTPTRKAPKKPRVMPQVWAMGSASSFDRQRIVEDVDETIPIGSPTPEDALSSPAQVAQRNRQVRRHRSVSRSAKDAEASLAAAMQRTRGSGAASNTGGGPPSGKHPTRQLSGSLTSSLRALHPPTGTDEKADGPLTPVTSLHFKPKQRSFTIPGGNGPDPLPLSTSATIPHAPATGVRHPVPLRVQQAARKPLTGPEYRAEARKAPVSPLASSSQQTSDKSNFALLPVVSKHRPPGSIRSTLRERSLSVNRATPAGDGTSRANKRKSLPSLSEASHTISTSPSKTAQGVPLENGRPPTHTTAQPAEPSPTKAVAEGRSPRYQSWPSTQPSKTDADTHYHNTSTSSAAPVNSPRKRALATSSAPGENPPASLLSSQTRAATDGRTGRIDSTAAVSPSGARQLPVAAKASSGATQQTNDPESVPSNGAISSAEAARAAGRSHRHRLPSFHLLFPATATSPSAAPLAASAPSPMGLQAVTGARRGEAVSKNNAQVTGDDSAPVVMAAAQPPVEWHRSPFDALSVNEREHQRAGRKAIKATTGSPNGSNGVVSNTGLAALSPTARGQRRSAAARCSKRSPGDSQDSHELTPSHYAGSRINTPSPTAWTTDTNRTGSASSPMSLSSLGQHAQQLISILPVNPSPTSHGDLAAASGGTTRSPRNGECSSLPKLGIAHSSPPPATNPSPAVSNLAPTNASVNAPSNRQQSRHTRDNKKTNHRVSGASEAAVPSTGQRLQDGHRVPAPPFSSVKATSAPPANAIYQQQHTESASAHQHFSQQPHYGDLATFKPVSQASSLSPINRVFNFPYLENDENNRILESTLDKMPISPESRLGVSPVPPDSLGRRAQNDVNAVVQHGRRRGSDGQPLGGKQAATSVASTIRPSDYDDWFADPPAASPNAAASRASGPRGVGTLKRSSEGPAVYITGADTNNGGHESVNNSGYSLF